jgi:hypothetical protein
MLAISRMTGICGVCPMARICGICPVARILVVCTMARARYRSVYQGQGSACDAGKDEKSPPSPRRRIKKTKEGCFHGKYPTTRSLTRHEQPFPGTPLLTDQSKLLQLRGLKKPGLGSRSRESRPGLITPPKLRFGCDGRRYAGGRPLILFCRAQVKRGYAPRSLSLSHIFILT